MISVSVSTTAISADTVVILWFVSLTVNFGFNTANGLTDSSDVDTGRYGMVSR